MGVGYWVIYVGALREGVISSLVEVGKILDGKDGWQHFLPLANIN